MEFWDRVIASSIGSFGGFVGALGIYLIIVWIEKGKKQKNLIQNLKYEIQYNIHLFKEYSEQITKCIECVSNDSKNTYTNINYSFVASHFAVLFYQEGLIVKKFKPEDMKRWNDFLIKVSEGSEEYVLNELDNWRKSEATKEEVHKALDFEREQLKSAIETSEYILKKL